MIKNRYDRWHKHNEISFYLSDLHLDEDQSRFLMLKILEGAVRDYCSFSKISSANDQETWELARDFLFDDDYRFIWGDLELSTEDFLDILDLDINWVREQTIKKFNLK